MRIIGQLISWVKRLFGRKMKTTVREDAIDAQDAAIKYEDVDVLNFTSIFANKLANIVVADTTVDVEGKSKRAEYLNDAMHKLWRYARKTTAQAFGKGGKFIVPYIDNGEPRFSVIDQHRVVINEVRGDRITSATFVADAIEVGGDKFYRITDYELKDGTHTIINKAVDEWGGDVDMHAFTEWENISDEISIQNVDRLLFGFVKCPVDNRVDRDLYGVPITYGSEMLIREIIDHLATIRREYKLTRPMLGLDSALWRKRPSTAVDSSGNTIPYGRDIRDVMQTAQDQDFPFIPVDSIDGNQPWLMFSPAIRDSAMYSRLMQLFALLEKSVGTSRGILTERESANATATEIKASMYDTFCIVAEMRAQWRRALEDVVYAWDVLAEYYGATPRGSRNDYTLKIDWDYSLYESSTESFAQQAELQSRGALSKAELRQWVKGGSLEDAEEAVAKVAQEAQAEQNQSAFGGMMM